MRLSQPTTYTKEMVLDAAFALIREHGWAGVTARAIAQRLGSSTMPIYSHLQSIAEVERELRGKARALLRTFQRRPWTEDALLNLAFGYIVFARDEQQLFRFLFLERPEILEQGELTGMTSLFASEFGDEGVERAALAALQSAGREALIQYSWIFTHGLAVLVNSGALGKCPDATILDLLRNAGEAFYLWAMGRAGTGDDRPGGTDETR